MRKHFLGRGHVGKGKKLEDTVKDSKIELCEYNDFCHKRKQQGYNCFELQEAKECGQVKKFYDKYGENGNGLGIGSMMEIPNEFEGEYLE